MISTKIVVSLCVLMAAAEAAVAPIAFAAPYAVAPFASSYTAHSVDHNIATPVAAAYHAAPAAYAYPYASAAYAYPYAPAAYHAAPAAYVAAFK